MRETDYHNYEKQYCAAQTRLWKAQISDDDKKLIEKFARDTKACGVGLGRLTKLIRVLAIMCERMGKSFKEATVDDIKELIHYYETGEYSFWTRHDAKVILKQFYKWMDGEDYPKTVRWICTTIPQKEKALVKDSELLTEEDVNKVIASASHPRNKAIIAILAESGARIGEIGNLTIGQVNIDSSGTVLNVLGKTGRRRLRIISGTPYLLRWLEIHPDRENPYSPLWVNIGTMNYHKIMTYEGIRKVLIDAFEKAGIKKRCHPYIFRHSRASQLARHLTEFQMNSYFGWAQGSSMPSTYVHMSGRDLDDDILRINGMKPGDKPIAFKPQSRICPRCKEINAENALYCCKCAEIVDQKLALQTKVEESQKPALGIKTPFTEWMRQDPEVQEVIRRKTMEYKGAVS